MPESPEISFGDRVRVRSAPVTEARGLAGLVGQVLGQTAPSVTGVDVIGELTSDYAINVACDEQAGSFWFAPELLELVDHSPGTEFRLKGVPKAWVRAEDGSWIEKAAE